MQRHQPTAGAVHFSSKQGYYPDSIQTIFGQNLARSTAAPPSRKRDLVCGNGVNQTGKVSKRIVRRTKNAAGCFLYSRTDTSAFTKNNTGMLFALFCRSLRDDTSLIMNHDMATLTFIPSVNRDLSFGRKKEKQGKAPRPWDRLQRLINLDP